MKRNAACRICMAMVRATAIGVVMAFFAGVWSPAVAADIFAFPKKTISVDGRTFKVLVADTAARREQGLSYTEREMLSRRGFGGMLFVFDREEERTFQAWHMKYNLIVLELKKLSGETYSVNGRHVLRIGTVIKVRARYVLEIPLLNNEIVGGTQ